MGNKPKQYVAQDFNGEWVKGWYVELHIANTDDHDRLIGYKTVPSIFNDEAGERTKGSYWRTIIPSTLREVPQQKRLFEE